EEGQRFGRRFGRRPGHRLLSSSPLAAGLKVNPFLCDVRHLGLLPCSRYPGHSWPVIVFVSGETPGDVVFSGRTASTPDRLRGRWGQLAFRRWTLACTVVSGVLHSPDARESRSSRQEPAMWSASARGKRLASGIILTLTLAGLAASSRLATHGGRPLVERLIREVDSRR